jgi:hypothetical protein
MDSQPRIDEEHTEVYSTSESMKPNLLAFGKARNGDEISQV